MVPVATRCEEDPGVSVLSRAEIASCRTGGHPERIVTWPHLDRVAGLDDCYAEEERYRTAVGAARPAP